MMLRTCLRPLVLTAAAVFAFGAFPAQAQDGGTPAPVAPAGEKIKLEINLAKDQAFDLVVKMTMSQNVNFGGMEMATDMDMNLRQSNKIESLDDAGVATMKSKVRRISGSFSNPMMGQFDFDSDKKAEESGNPALDQMSQQFTQMAGKETIVRLSKDGTVADGGNDAAATEAMRAMGGISKLPKDAVGIGDSWTTESSGQVQGMGTKTKMKSTVKAIDADTVTVTHDGTLEMSAAGGPGGNPMAALVAKMKVKTTKIAGESKISRKDGYVLVSDVTTDMELELPADENAQDPMLAAGMTMVMKQKVHQERKPATPDATAPVTPSEPDKK